MKAVWIFLVLVLLVACIGLATERVHHVKQIETLMAEVNHIPTIADIQIMVGAEPDGVIGDETKSKWNVAVCNQYAGDYDYVYKEVQNGK